MVSLLLLHRFQQFLLENQFAHTTDKVKQNYFQSEHRFLDRILSFPIHGKVMNSLWYNGAHQVEVSPGFNLVYARKKQVKLGLAALTFYHTESTAKLLCSQAKKLWVITMVSFWGYYDWATLYVQPSRLWIWCMLSAFLWLASTFSWHEYKGLDRSWNGMHVYSHWTLVYTVTKKSGANHCRIKSVTQQ